MDVVIIALGLVFVLEGLVFALAPSRIEQLLQMFAELPLATRRNLGLGAIALGVVLVWLGQGLGG